MNLRRHAYPMFGDRRLASILPSEVQAGSAGLTAAGLSAATVQVIHGIVASIFKPAVRDRKFARVAVRIDAAPRKVRTRVDPLGTDTVHALAPMP